MVVQRPVGIPKVLISKVAPGSRVRIGGTTATVVRHDPDRRLVFLSDVTAGGFSYRRAAWVDSMMVEIERE